MTEAEAQGKSLIVVDGVTLRWVPPADSLDVAWAEAEAALPEGWHFELESGAFDASGLYRASAHWVDFYGDGPPLGQTSDWTTTPASALRALAAKLRTGS